MVGGPLWVLSSWMSSAVSKIYGVFSVALQHCCPINFFYNRIIFLIDLDWIIKNHIFMMKAHNFYYSMSMQRFMNFKCQSKTQ